MIELVLLFAASTTAFKLSRPGALFIIPLAVHYLSTKEITGTPYFLSSSVVAMFSALALSIRDDDLSERLLFLSFAVIFVNAVGWVMWLTYQPSVLYEFLFMTIYVTAIAIIGIDDGRSTEHNDGDNGLLGIITLCLQPSINHKK